MTKLKPTYYELDRFKHISGIYAIGVDDEILYIGQSVSIGDRLLCHFHPDAFDYILEKTYREKGAVNRYKALGLYHHIFKRKDEIWFTILARVPQSALNQEESKLIDQYKPRYNYEGIDKPFAGTMGKI